MALPARVRCSSSDAHSSNEQQGDEEPEDHARDEWVASWILHCLAPRGWVEEAVGFAGVVVFSRLMLAAIPFGFARYRIDGADIGVPESDELAIPLKPAGDDLHLFRVETLAISS